MGLWVVRPFHGSLGGSLSLLREFRCLLWEVQRNRSRSAPKRQRIGSEKAPIRPEKAHFPRRIFARSSLKIWGLSPRLWAPVQVLFKKVLRMTLLGSKKRTHNLFANFGGPKREQKSALIRTYIFENHAFRRRNFKEIRPK